MIFSVDANIITDLILGYDITIEDATTMNEQPDFPLRQRKYARTKLALMNAALERLKDKSLEEISVRELCEEAEVSEATFFNYFPSKTDLLVYFVQLWTIEAGWHAHSGTRRIRK
jgi:hypothetical protein